MQKLLRRQSMTEDEYRKLMAIYAESNRENIGYFFPELKDEKLGVQKVEEQFVAFMKTDFFSEKDHCYYILSVDDEWVAAMRFIRLAEHSYFLEALETKPEQRRKGYATALFTRVIRKHRPEGSFTVKSIVSKHNEASLAFHEKVGFKPEGMPSHSPMADQKLGFTYIYEAPEEVDEA